MMILAEKESYKSTCLKRRVGAVIRDDVEMISVQGYNHSLKGTQKCKEAGCRRVDAKSGTKLEECVCVHAEQDVIRNATLHMLHFRNCTMYVTTEPCNTCAKLIVLFGIKRVVILEKYNNNSLGMEIMKNAGVVIEYIKESDLIG